MIYLDKLKTKHLKLTPKRRAILDYFSGQGRCLSPEKVWEELKQQFKRLGLPSIYRNLETFVDCGILVKIQREDRRLYYALCYDHTGGHHHHHIVCVKCGKVDEVDGCALVSMVKTSGYKVLKHFVQLEGLCPKCL